MILRRILSGLGRVLIGAGMLILLFVVYELWGTGIAEARNQDKLKDSFNRALPAAPPPTVAGAPPTTLPPPPEGDAIAIINIPDLGVEKAVVEGVGVADLKKGPGHYPDTPMPGEPGNSAIAGHRTTYGAPFGNLDELAAGDKIQVRTRSGTFDYAVERTTVVKPTEVSVLEETEANQLTLTTCHPKFSAAERLIVVALLQGKAVEAPPPVPGAAPAQPVSSTEADLSGVKAARGPTVIWGSLAAGILVLVWLLGRVWRRWPAYLLGAAPFLIVLFVFYENVSRLLPANI